VQYGIVALAALLVAGLTLFSGFGLSTMLLPVLALFLPVQAAVAATAIVHLLNNLFKVALVGRHADWQVSLRFAVPAAAASFLGAALLGYVARQPPLLHYELAGRVQTITPVKLTIGVLLVAASLFELLPRFERLAIDRKYLPVGGVLSGFFGGLSGLQGALRAPFLINAGLSRDAFIGTSAVAAVVVDVARLIVYGTAYATASFGRLPPGGAGLVAVAMLAALLGSWIGARLVPRVTLRSLQVIVGVMLLMAGAALAAGLA
jgi:uncharacterized membrane protein YfcA